MPGHTIDECYTARYHIYDILEQDRIGWNVINTLKDNEANLIARIVYNSLPQQEKDDTQQYPETSFDMVNTILSKSDYSHEKWLPPQSWIEEPISCVDGHFQQTTNFVAFHTNNSKVNTNYLVPQILKQAKDSLQTMRPSSIVVKTIKLNVGIYLKLQNLSGAILTS